MNDRMDNITLEKLIRLLREFRDPAATVNLTERAWVTALLFKQTQKVNDLSGLLFEKF